MNADGPAAPAVARPRRATRRSGAVVTSVGAGLALVLAGCGGGGPVGAAAPPRADVTSTGTSALGSTPAATTPGRPASAAATAGDAPAAAAGVVTAYFTEIDTASRAGRVADVTALALPGCQACALDVGVTRDLAQRGLRADAAPYAVTAVSARPRQGLACAVTFLATTSTVGLLDPAGRRVDEAAGVPDRAGTAELALTGAGWRIQTIRYARRQS
jgi:hypothetical protein